MAASTNPIPSDPPPETPRRDPNDGWYECQCGQRHWGLRGAAGLLVRREQQVLLQLRGARSHWGGTWGLPGGARQSGESSLEAALREGEEEVGLAAEQLIPEWWVIWDHHGWSYTTIAVATQGDVDLTGTNWESERLAWVDVDAVEGWDLHPGLQETWPLLRSLWGAKAELIVDAANVMGSTPDGWWKDRAGAARRLRDQLEILAKRGIADLGELPPAGWYPRVTLVVEGQARGIGVGKTVQVVEAPGEGDHTIVEQALKAVQATSSSRGKVEVVTADKGLIGRVRQVGAQIMRPSQLLNLIR